jgi:hypothetical protein
MSEITLQDAAIVKTDLFAHAPIVKGFPSNGLQMAHPSI